MKNKLLWLLILNAGLFASVPNPADVIVGIFMDYKLFHMDSVAFKPGSIVVFAIIVIIISSHSSNAYKTFIASNKKPVLSRLGI
ncbi:hypothetical protein [Helicobacter pylori]|uniref:Uncharacterized protein n=1 Tax=Helicobacter pylori TaxID=210 RepID=A0AB36S451_HELPX|nr:hypothetical protein [Helicobacter pylori]PDW60836.1 hypothetical protein BB443_01140 [Helicobacter pylori]PDX39449.1 hypothetical protein BB468_00020 [Helicobacter pylori]